MTERKVKEMVPVTKTVYVAFDGTEYNDFYECKHYEELKFREQREKPLRKYRVNELDDQIPINIDASFSEVNDYRWFKVYDEDEFKELDHLLGDKGLEKPETYPGYICIECENYECDGWDTDYSYTLDESIKVTKTYFEKFGIRVEFVDVVKEKDKQIEELWRELSDIGIYENEEKVICIDEDWHQFFRGTELEDIWYWFDDQHSKGLGWLMENVQ